jgi:hypothetical protein
MGKFFQSELVRGTIQEMTVLQEYCFRCAMNMALLSSEEKLNYFNALEELVEKQKIFYTRVKLSDDPEAISIAENMKQAVVILGGNPKLTVNECYDDLLEKIKMFKEHLKTGTED